MAAMDCTVWPADSAYLAEGLRVMGDILSMASDNMGFVQYPVLTTQTSTAALIKHRHILDNSMMKHNLTVHHHVQILYSKPNSTANDTRALSQPGVPTSTSRPSTRAQLSSMGRLAHVSFCVSLTSLALMMPRDRGPVRESNRDLLSREGTMISVSCHISLN